MFVKITEKSICNEYGITDKMNCYVDNLDYQFAALEGKNVHVFVPGRESIFIPVQLLEPRVKVIRVEEVEKVIEAKKRAASILEDEIQGYLDLHHFMINNDMKEIGSNEKELIKFIETFNRQGKTDKEKLLSLRALLT